MNKLRQRLTLLHVKQAIGSLQEQGIKPTTNQILKEVIRGSNGTVGGSKGTVLKLKRQLNGTNSTLQSGTQTGPSGTDKALLSTLEVQLWAKLEARLDDKLREQLAIYPIKNHPESPLDDALQEMHELWLDSVTRYTEVQAQIENLEREVQRLSQPEDPVTETLRLENQELKAQLQVLQQLVQTKEEEIEELSLENQELKLPLRQNNPAQSNNQEAVSQITTPSISSNTPTNTVLLDSYFQILTQLQSLSPARKYDCAMTLFLHGIGPSEASRILKVNKGSLQHYKDGKRQRPKETESNLKDQESQPHSLSIKNH